MLQIKTVHNRLDNSEAFDTAINVALAEGWVLTKRELIPSYVALYAELEREIITEAEQCCENCAHYATPNGKEPCLSCDGDKWEPEK
jgi:hypothetical protein